MKDAEIRQEGLGRGIFCYTSGFDRVTTDALLLSDFARVRPGDTAADLGSGCGVIPLMWLREPRITRVTAVEIREGAASLISRAALDNGLSDRLRVVCADLCALEGIVGAGSFSVVSMNPPYKREGDGRTSANPDAAMMRNELACNPSAVCASAARLLMPAGRLCICCRPERLTDYICAMRENGLEPKLLRLVCQRVGERPSLFLLRALKGGAPGLDIPPALCIEGNGANGFSDEMNEIYGEYGKERGK